MRPWTLVQCAATFLKRQAIPFRGQEFLHSLAASILRIALSATSDARIK